jgi:hypothetical protein
LAVSGHVLHWHHDHLGACLTQSQELEVRQIRC